MRKNETFTIKSNASGTFFQAAGMPEPREVNLSDQFERRGVTAMMKRALGMAKPKD
jgi:hypothetical protein